MPKSHQSVQIAGIQGTKETVVDKDLYKQVIDMHLLGRNVSQFMKKIA